MFTPQFLKQKVRDEKTADDEKYCHALISIAEGGVKRDSIQQSGAGVSKDYDKNRYRSETIQ
jgi:hypothetical protein